ncbi:TPA: hypothetical protein OVC47_001570 [Staphylococcus aureus]|nr:hypothetical protein [Staphylococcus aureus]HEA0121257.1 hypothetical protein [Staphylococcus aureus]
MKLFKGGKKSKNKKKKENTTSSTKSESKKTKKFKFFKSQRERRREKANRDEDFEMFRGIAGDRDYRTYQGLINGILVFIGVAITVLGGILTIGGLNNYKQFLDNNTTPIGDTLTFGKSEASLKFGGAWTDKNRNVTVVKLKYSKGARSKLSTQGKQYKLFIKDDENKVKKNIKMGYGVLGTHGDGFLFINGKLDKKAYQVIITNQLDITSGDDSETDTSGSSSTSNISKRADELTQSELEESLSKTKRSDYKDNGRINFGKNSHKPNVDYIDFRVNAYSDSTKVINDNFQKPNGEIDYSKVIDKTTIDDVVKAVDKDIKQNKEKTKSYKAGIKEFEQRVKKNKDDEDAKENIKTLKKKVEDNEEELKELENLKKRYIEEDFDKSSFGDMQENYKVIHSTN